MSDRGSAQGSQFNRQEYEQRYVDFARLLGMVTRHADYGTYDLFVQFAGGHWETHYASEYFCALKFARMFNHQTTIEEALHACGAGTPEDYFKDYFKDECDRRGI
jgi:hypothetical protein